MNLRIIYTPLILEQVLSEGKTEVEFNEVVAIVQKSVLDSVREERTRLLSKSDWSQYNDSPLSPEKKLEWANYRQALRDITDNIDFSVAMVIDDNFFPPQPEQGTT